MKIDIVSAFPGLFPGPLAQSIPGRVIERGLAEIRITDLRDYTHDRHRTIDDAPFGGGGGMVLKAEPIVAAVEDLMQRPRVGSARVLFTSPRGRLFDHAHAVELSVESHLIIVCGHYKGFDERAFSQVAAEEISIGDYVLSGGELAAMVIVDALLRLQPGALGNFDSAAGDSFFDGLLEGPIYTRPRSFRGIAVPEVLFSGDHQKIRGWRLQEALRLTRERRPDLLERRDLTQEEERLLVQIEEGEMQATEAGQELDP
jgi:tRNA (guanine37-N1)-methyltransferase